MTLPLGAVLMDVEGTTSPVSFVRSVLFPFARARLADWIARHRGDPAVAAVLAEVRRMAPGAPEERTLAAWMDADAKLAPLKDLQGMIWREGYEAGELRGELFDDVAANLARWARAGVRLYVYSAGSVAAQKQVFGHSTAGDLTALFGGFFDTRVGSKRDPESFTRLSIGIALPPVEIVYLSRVEDELDAAAAAGLRTCQIVRRGDGTAAGERHPIAADFDAVAAMVGLPVPA